ncbi:hypothetical protein FDI40_gp501 [Agrobacterium phage Atu_ph07]|uniref:Uncharacterized protein n=1 Tax=Agrobacterium phage Atu_ph07 TaxID=2024264 RepID=A0A2L0V0H0_9CAUD|nr:hypothetical protein FDI40_gp501 [Agrobacterium phage Atu_ph07]AUZ95260.1 hypothetical protein [Agrobacterium phage Atu_ph07]
MKTLIIDNLEFSYTVRPTMTDIKLPSGATIGVLNANIGTEVSYNKYRVTSKNVREFILSSVDYA